MDLALNNLQRLIRHKTQPPNQSTFSLQIIHDSPGLLSDKAFVCGTSVVFVVAVV